VLQFVAVCCRVLQCVAVCCSMLQRVAACCSGTDGQPQQHPRGGFQCVAVCCSVLPCVAVCGSSTRWAAATKSPGSVAVSCSVLPCVAVCCSVSQCVAGEPDGQQNEVLAGCCSVLQCVLQYVALRCRVLKLLQCVAVEPDGQQQRSPLGSWGFPAHTLLWGHIFCYSYIITHLLSTYILLLIWTHILLLTYDDNCIRHCTHGVGWLRLVGSIKS